MIDNVYTLPVVTKLAIPVQRVLETALRHHKYKPFERILIIGVREGDEYFACSEPDGGTVVWDMARAQHKLMNIVDRLTDDDA